MRTSVILFVSLLISCVQSSQSDKSAFKCSEKFIEYILDDLKEEGSFIVIDVNVSGATNSICLSNIDLFRDLTYKRGVSRDEYKNTVMDILQGKQTYEADSSILHFYKIQADPSIDSVYKQGLDSLLIKYFPNGFSVSHVENKRYMASILYENCIISWVDDYTGSMIIKRDY